jgi:hypothetical protein
LTNYPLFSALAQQNSSFVDGNQAPRSKLCKTVLGRGISMAHKTYSVSTLSKCSVRDSFRGKVKLQTERVPLATPAHFRVVNIAHF